MAFNLKDKMANAPKSSFKGNGGGNFQPAYNLPVRIVEVHVSDDKKATPATDYIEGVLMAPAFGLATGETVKVKIKDGRHSEGNKVPMEIFDLQPGRKKGTGQRMGKHGAIVAEKARMGADGMITCDWIKVVEHSYTPENELLHVGMMTVNFLKRPREGEQGYARQHRDIHFPENVVRISSIDNDGEKYSSEEVFKQSVLLYLEDRSNGIDEEENRPLAGGRPMVMIRLINNDEINTDEDAVMSSIISIRWDKENSRWHTPEESLDLWMNDQDNESWLEFIENGDSVVEANGTLELWPAWRFQTGKMEIEKQVGIAERGYVHAAELFAAPKIDVENNVIRGDNGNVREDYGLIAEGVHAVAKFQDHDDWKANFSYSLELYPQRLWLSSELVTKHLPEATRDFFEKRAEARVKEKRAYLSEKKNNNAANSAPSGGTAQDFGGDDVPDPTSGLRPR